MPADYTINFDASRRLYSITGPGLNKPFEMEDQKYHELDQWNLLAEIMRELDRRSIAARNSLFPPGRHDSWRMARRTWAVA